MRAIRSGRFDPRLEVAARNVDRAWDVSLVPLVLLADVENERIARFDQFPCMDGVDLVDLVFDLGEKLAVRRHCFPNDSEAGAT